jgi:hypothetical protein
VVYMGTQEKPFSTADPLGEKGANVDLVGPPAPNVPLSNYERLVLDGLWQPRLGS